MVILRNFNILITLSSEFSRNLKQTHWSCSLCLIAKSINISLRWLAMILSQLILYRYECFIGKYTTHSSDLVAVCSAWGKTKCSRQKLKQRKEKCFTKRGNSLDYLSKFYHPGVTLANLICTVTFFLFVCFLVYRYTLIV